MKKARISRMDIAVGKAQSADKCPVALGLLRDGGFSKVSVGKLSTYVASHRVIGGNWNWKKYKNGKKLYNWIGHFDNGKMKMGGSGFEVVFDDEKNEVEIV